MEGHLKLTDRTLSGAHFLGIWFKTVAYNHIVSPFHAYYLYSAQCFISILSSGIDVNAVIKADARRAFVINGTLRSMAARRIL